MNRAAHILQQQVFLAIEADTVLLSAFALFEPAAEQAQFSYDGMRSQWRDLKLQVSEHSIGFSVWTQQAGLHEGAELIGALQHMMERVSIPNGSPVAIAPTGHAIIHHAPLSLESAYDPGGRQWRQQLSHLFLVQAK